jgi:hypothetical protein
MGKGSQMNKANPQQAQTVWAYLAGMIDGEGCISVSRYSTGNAYKAELIIVQKNPKLIKWLYHNISCTRKFNIVARRTGFMKGNYWRWSISGDETLRVLKNCLPYLIEKQDQAELAIELIESKKTIRNRKGDKYEELLKRHNKICQELKSLKKSGAVAETECVDSNRRSDSPDCKDGKLAESAEMTDRPLIPPMWDMDIIMGRKKVTE